MIPQKPLDQTGRCWREVFAQPEAGWWKRRIRVPLTPLSAVVPGPSAKCQHNRKRQGGAGEGEEGECLKGWETESFQVGMRGALGEEARRGVKGGRDKVLGAGTSRSDQEVGATFPSNNLSLGSCAET